MNGYKIPVFKKGSLLTQEMLEALKQFGLSYTECCYDGFGNGVLRGCAIHGEKGVVYIGKGMIWHGGSLFYVPECSVRVKSVNEWQVIKVYVSDLEKNDNFEERKMELRVTGNTEREKNAVELCRVRLQQGALLRSKYRSFEDIDTEFDTIRLIDAQWAAFGGDSIHPAILEQFADEALKMALSDPYDIGFIQQILSQSGGAVQRKQILFYIAARQKKAYQELSNQEIYKELGVILRQMKTGKAPETGGRRPSRMIVD